MDITTDQIKAFLEISRKGSFSGAALHLGLTQAALSLRIKKLEDSIEKSLIIRGKSGLSLTEAGKQFLLFAETFEGLEKEYLGNLLQAGEGKLTGSLRIGCFSTIGRSLILPSLEKLLADNPDVEFSFFVKETHELSGLLQSGEVDFIFLDQEVKREGVLQDLVGFEEFVFVTGKKNKNQEIFLNHDENDLMSFKYFEAIGQPRERLRRRFLDEIYSVMDGVVADLGVSVLPYHLAVEKKGMVVPSPRKKLKSPVYLCYKKRSYYTKLFHAAREAMEEHLKKHLAQS